MGAEVPTPLTRKVFGMSQGWINVEDALPEHRDEVFAQHINGKVFAAYINAYGRWTRLSDGKNLGCSFYIKCWYKPEPPKLEGPFNFTDDAIEYTENGKVVAVLNVLAPAGWAMKDIIEWVNEVLVTKDSKKPFKPKKLFAVGYAGCLTDSPMNVSIGERIFQIHATEQSELRKFVNRLNEMWTKHKF